MTTARDVIAEWLVDGGFASRHLAPDFADSLMARLQTAPDYVRLELAGMLNPWRPIGEVPKEMTVLLHNGGKTEDWLGAVTETPYAGRYTPTHFRFLLPAPPSEDRPK